NVPYARPIGGLAATAPPTSRDLQPRRTFGVSFPVLTTRAHPLTEEVRTEARPMSTTTLADVLYPGGHAPGGEPQSPPSDLTPNSPNGGSSPGSDDGDGSSRKRSASGSNKEGKERTANKICRVCGDKAYSYNFNVITCESCKAFFRRNANKEKEIRCPFNESCEINVVSRRFCQRCRLFKCFQVGMKKEWIMTDEARLEKKARVEENRERRREEAKRKEGDGHHYGSSSGGHYRTTSVSSSNGGNSNPGSAKSSTATCAATAAAAAVAESVSIRQQQHHHHHQQQHVQQLQQMQPMFQPELPTLVAPSTTTSNMLDALAQQVAAAAATPAALQQPFPSVAALPTAAALVAAVAAPPPPPSNSELVAHAIALEQQMQQTPFGVVTTPAPAPSAAATAAAVYQAAAAHHHQQQQQQQQMAAAISQQIAQMTAAAQPVTAATPQQQLENATLAAALALPPPVVATPTTAAATAAILNAAVATASPLGPLTQTALIMDASAAMTQQLLAAAAPPPPPPSAIAAVATTMLLQPPQQPTLLQSAAALQPDRCCCTCACGKYHAGRAIVDQAQEEWESERRGRRSTQSAGDELGIAELLPSASSVNWLNTATNQNPLTEGALSSADDAFPPINHLKDNFVATNPLHAPHLGLKGDPEFGPMEADDEQRLKFLHDANGVWTQPLEGDENKLHSQSLPTKETMLQMMVGAIRRMIKMARKFPRFTSLHDTDQIKLFSSCYLDVMIIRGAMAYDPKENAWKGPTNKHDYKIKMDAMNDGADNMYQQSIRLYSMFKDEYRTDESAMLLLNMIVLFDPCAKGLTGVQSVTTENNAYKRCLKRYMYTQLMKKDPKMHPNQVQFEYSSLLERLATVRKMNSGARGIMEEHADNMDPLLQELLQRDEEAQKLNSKRHSPRGVGSVSSQGTVDDQSTFASTSAQA
ncbi:hypothetical protein PMAYCL1PPCAC_00875, partial [Pristionchus mayeri]